MNRPTQLTLLGIFAGTVSISLLLKYLLETDHKQQQWLSKLDKHLPLQNNSNEQQVAEELESVELPPDVEEELQIIKTAPQIVASKPEPAAPKLSAIKAVSPTKNDDFPLTLGSQGRRVTRLQVWLLRNFGWTGKLSGVLDENTLELMKKHLKTEALDANCYNKYRMDRPVQQQKIIR